LNLAEGGTAPTLTTEGGVELEVESLGLDSASEQTSGPSVQTEHEESRLGEEEDEIGGLEEDGENEQQDGGQTLPLPLFE
jgi:hypothetical protein